MKGSRWATRDVPAPHLPAQEGGGGTGIAALHYIPAAAFPLAAARHCVRAPEPPFFRREALAREVTPRVASPRRIRAPVDPHEPVVIRRRWRHTGRAGPRCGACGACGSPRGRSLTRR
eukprot:365134-Chlamydomonas_euryale.AAC.1